MHITYLTLNFPPSWKASSNSIGTVVCVAKTDILLFPIKSQEIKWHPVQKQPNKRQMMVQYTANYLIQGRNPELKASGFIIMLQPANFKYIVLCNSLLTKQVSLARQRLDRLCPPIFLKLFLPVIFGFPICFKNHRIYCKNMFKQSLLSWILEI